MDNQPTSDRHSPEIPQRRRWVVPSCADLPPLEQLTLQTSGIVGDCDPLVGCSFSVVPTERGAPHRHL